MQHQHRASGSSPGRNLLNARPCSLRSARRSCLSLLTMLSLCACSNSRDQASDAAREPAPAVVVHADAGIDAATPASPTAGKQVITLIPGQKAGRIGLGLTLEQLESLTHDWSKEPADAGTVWLRRAPWAVLVKDGVAAEMTFTLEPGILPVVNNRSVRDLSTLSEVAKLFPDCQPATTVDGVDVITCQGGQTRLEKRGADGDVVVRFTSLPAAPAKGKRRPRK